MYKRLLHSAYIWSLLFLLQLGCQPVPDTVSQGTLAVAVQWPGVGEPFTLAAIPVTTDRIEVEVAGTGLAQPQSLLLKRRQSGEEKTRMTLPIGPKVVRAKAFNKDNRLLALAVASVTIEKFKVTQAVLELEPLPEQQPGIPANEAPVVDSSAVPVESLPAVAESPGTFPQVSQSVAPQPLLQPGGTSITGPVPAANSTTASSPNTTASSTSASTAAQPLPAIKTLAPLLGPVGSTVTLTGSEFKDASRVQFNGVDGSFSVNGDGTVITATVPVGALSGAVSVTNKGGTSASSPFTVQASVTLVVKDATGNNNLNSLITLKVLNSTIFPAVTIPAGSNSGTLTVGIPGEWTIEASIGSNGEVKGQIQVIVDKNGQVSQSEGTAAVPLKLSPLLATMAPAPAAIGQTLALTGDGFAATATLQFGTVSVSPTSPPAVTATTLSVKVPDGINKNESLTVALNGKTSNALTFSLTGVVTAAGTGATSAPPTTPVPALTAVFKNPADLVFDSQGNLLSSDFNNHCIRKLDKAGNVSLFAGSCTTLGDADASVATSARFNQPWGLAIDAADNLYIADSGNHRIRKITPTGVVSTLAGSSQGNANNPPLFNSPSDVAMDTSGNLYVSDKLNHCIRKREPNGTVTTFAGICGTPGALTAPGFLVYASGFLYVASSGAASVHSIDGVGAITTFNFTTAPVQPFGLALKDNFLYVADRASHCINRFNLGGPFTLALVAGTCSNTPTFQNGEPAVAKFNDPMGMVFDGSGNLYISDFANHRIRKLIP